MGLQRPEKARLFQLEARGKDTELGATQDACLRCT